MTGWKKRKIADAQQRTTMNKYEALKLALEAIEAFLSAGTEDEDYDAYENLCDARKAIREALAQPEQEPVAIEHCLWARNGNTPCPHTTPPQRPWVGLTKEERRAAWDSCPTHSPTELALAIEAKLKEKNHG